MSDFLSGKKYFDVVPHGQYVGSEPFDKWIKPSIVLIGESNYSDAHLFPLAYKAKGIGKTRRHAGAGHRHVRLVGEPDRSDDRLRHPDGLLADARWQVRREQPDRAGHPGANDPDVMAAGRDQQIEAAVKELMKP